MKKYPYLPYFIVPVSGLSTDIYVPAMPEMMQNFHCSAAHIQYSITFFVLALGLAQFIAGPISDAWGRKKLMIAGAIGQLFAISALLTIHNASVLWLARFIQGISAGFLVVPGRAIISDCYKGQVLKKKYSTMTTCFSVAPIVAPFIGGFAQTYVGWQMCFIILLVYVTILMAYIIFAYQETHPDPQAFHWEKMYQSYTKLLSHANYALLAVAACLATVYSNTFVTIGAFLFEKELGLSAINYGYLGLLMGFCWFCGNLACRLLIHWPRQQRIAYALLAQSLALLVCGFIPAALKYFNIVSLLCLFVPVILAAAFIFPIFVSEALSLYPRLAASANACFFSMLWLSYSLVSYIASFLPVNEVLWLVVFFMTANLLSLTLSQVLRQRLAQ